MAKLTKVRRQILQNIKDHKKPYEGFEGSQLGGAIRSVQMMRGLLGDKPLVAETEKDGLILTEWGRKALENGEY